MIIDGALLAIKIFIDRYQIAALLVLLFSFNWNISLVSLLPNLGLFDNCWTPNSGGRQAIYYYYHLPVD